MSGIVSLVKNCLQVSNSVSLLLTHFCGPDLSGMTFAGFTRPVEIALAVY